MNTDIQKLLESIDYTDSEVVDNVKELIKRNTWIKGYGYPEQMCEWFVEGLSKLRGDKWENGWLQANPQLLPKENEDHDALLDSNIVTSNNLKGNKIEIKFCTSLQPDSAKQQELRGSALSWAERSNSIVIEEGVVSKPKGGSFQQVKPLCADYGLFSVVFNNGAIHYWLPYHLVSKTPKVENTEPGKVPLSGQHRGSKVEGQVNMTARFHELFLLDVTLDKPYIEDFSKYDLKKYENLVF